MNSSLDKWNWSPKSSLHIIQEEEKPLNSHSATHVTSPTVFNIRLSCDTEPSRTPSDKQMVSRGPAEGGEDEHCGISLILELLRLGGSHHGWKSCFSKTIAAVSPSHYRADEQNPQLGRVVLLQIVSLFWDKLRQTEGGQKKGVFQPHVCKYKEATRVQSKPNCDSAAPYILWLFDLYLQLIAAGAPWEHVHAEGKVDPVSQTKRLIRKEKSLCIYLKLLTLSWGSMYHLYITFLKILKAAVAVIVS